MRPNNALITAGFAAISLLAGAASAVADESDVIAEVVVTSQRRPQPLLEHAGNITRIDSEALQQIQHQHIHELLTRVSGVWVSRGSGQEHLTAIRSPVLTGAGSCGGYLFLEDGIPIRPAGFCNVNQLFEINTEQARAIEVVRGPGNALFGSNALHGIVNVVMPTPDVRDDPLLALEVGANDYRRARADLPFDRNANYLASVVYADDGGFRDDSGYKQGKLHLKRSWSPIDSALDVGFTATDLRQETAGFIFGEDAYKDSSINRSNLNPEAFRDASSQRLYAIWKKTMPGFGLDVRPYVRHSGMKFLQHFLPGKPLEENGHSSAGVITAATFSSSKQQTIAGVDLEWSSMHLRETQFGPTEGSAFLVETRPEGKHYDFEVSSASIAPFVQAEFKASEKLILSAGLRAEYMHYDYENGLPDGNTRDDGTVCGFGGCLYTRPADRTDSFSNLAPTFAVNYALSPATAVYSNLTRGFRAPQMTEMYRLQNGQEIADLDSERVDSLEIGLRTSRKSWSAEFSAYAMRKRDSVFRDAEGFNVNAARSRHRGIETALDWQIDPDWMLAVDATFARHTYDFDRVGALGETFIAGRDVDTAPRWLASVELLYDPAKRINLALQWTGMGAYYVDAENRFRYPGHALANFRANLRMTPQFDITLRLNNVLDTNVADRADYAFGSFRYFPGRGRELFAELRYRPVTAR